MSVFLILYLPPVLAPPPGFMPDHFAGAVPD
jgi:hypothetical protein